ncbi:transposase [Staphylococcus pseudintermedius]|nr:transposase [Staphylococcus pseudintermedius]
MRKPKITQLLRRHGHTVTQRTVSRLMKALGIRSITKKEIQGNDPFKASSSYIPQFIEPAV